MIFHNADTDTITVEESVYDGGSRSVRAKINDDPRSGLSLYQSEDYCAVSVDLHLNERDQTAFEVVVDTYEPTRRGTEPWATLSLCGGYRNSAGASGTMEGTAFVSAKNLVEIRDELSRAIRRARKDGHIS